MGREPTVRLAASADVDGVVALLAELGYPSASDAVFARLADLARRPDHVVWVAEDGGAIVGWIHAGVPRTLEAGERAEILGLVVDHRHRRGGVGRALVEAVERWAAGRGLREIAVRSNVVRAESHPFYEGRGYARVKTQHVYVKPLS